MVITINVSEEQIKRAEHLAQQRRMKTGERASRSSEFGRAVDALFLAECLTDQTYGTPECHATTMQPVTN